MPFCIASPVERGDYDGNGSRNGIPDLPQLVAELTIAIATKN